MELVTLSTSTMCGAGQTGLPGLGPPSGPVCGLSDLTGARWCEQCLAQREAIWVLCVHAVHFRCPPLIACAVGKVGEPGFGAPGCGDSVG